MSCHFWVASCPLFFLCPERVGGNCGPQSMMNDEFVLHNNSSGGCWISGSVCCWKGDAWPTQLKGEGGLFCVLKAALCSSLSWNKWNFIEDLKKSWSYFLRTTWLCLCLQKLQTSAKTSAHLDVSACARMQKMWKDEVWWVERGVCFQECRGSKWRMCTLETSYFPQLQLCNSVPALTCGRGSNLFICASSWCCSRISVSAAFQILSVWGFNWSQPYSPLPTVKTALCLSHRFQLWLCFTCSPEPQCVTRPHCYHALICNPNPKCCIFISFPNSTVPTKDSAVISCSPVYFLACVILAHISACLSSNLCWCVNWSLTVWSSNLQYVAREELPLRLVLKVRTPAWVCVFDDSAVFPSVALQAELAGDWTGEGGEAGQRARKEMKERVSGSWQRLQWNSNLSLLKYYFFKWL